MTAGRNWAMNLNVSRCGGAGAAALNPPGYASGALAKVRKRKKVV